MSTRIYESLVADRIGNLDVRVWRAVPDGCPTTDDNADIIAKIAELRDQDWQDDFSRTVLDALADLPRVSAVEVRIGSNAVLAYNDWP